MKRTCIFLLIGFLLAPDLFAAQYIPDSAISPNITRDAEIIPTGETNAVCVSNTGTVAPAFALCATVDVTGKTVYYKPPEVVSASKPANHGIVIVTDGSTSSDCTVGGGANKVPCWWNGSAWVALGSGGGGGSGDLTDVNGTSNEICVTNSTGPAPTVALCSTVSIASKILQLGRVDLSGDITPTAITGTTNNWAPTSLSTSSTIRFSGNAVWTMTGLTGGANGRILTLYNAGSFEMIFSNENSNSTAANRFAFGTDQVIGPGEGFLIQYDGTAQRWRSLSTVNFRQPKYCADAGASDTYACSLTPVITFYLSGEHYFFKANTANTGAATLNLNSLGAKTIKKVIGGITTDLDTNDIRAGQIVQVVYDGTNFQMQSMLGNSPTGISGLTTGKLPKAASATSIADSGISEDASNSLITKPIIQGDCSTNCWILDPSAITGQKTQSPPNHTGIIPVYPNSRKAMSVELFDPATDVTTGNGKVYVRVPPGLNGTNIVAVASNVVTAGTTGLTSVQITRCAAAASGNACSGTTTSVLSTVLSIDSGENDSSTAATPAVINTSNDDVSTGQLLRMDVTAVSTVAPKGLTITLEFELP